MPGASPGSTLARACVTASGLDRPSFGYARSCRDGLTAGAVDDAMRAPPAAETTTSFQPRRPAYVSSRSSRDDAFTEARPGEHELEPRRRQAARALGLLEALANAA